MNALAKTPDHNPPPVDGSREKECNAYMKRDTLAPFGGLLGRPLRVSADRG